MLSPELQTRKRSPKPSFFNLFYAQISSHPYFWISIALLLVSLFVISATVTTIPAPPCLPNRTAAAAVEECPYGRVYAYDLPSTFNHDLLLHNCTELNPWNWQCGIAANHGLGNPAAELRRILPENISGSWFRTNQFALELIFHRRILQHKCRSLEPESAAAFYIPFYAGLAVGKYLWINDTAKRDWHSEMMLRWVQRQKPWLKSNGSDHFTTVGRITWDFRRLTDPGQLWGSTYLNMPEMQSVTRFIIEKAPGDHQDIGVPYPTGFHPETGETLRNWQEFVRAYNRSSLFTFIGAARGSVSNDFRGLLLNYCSNISSSSCRALDCAVAHCSTASSAILESLLGSEFCLQPKGDSYTRRSVFDCMIAGAVPVFFWKRTAYDQYDWFLPGEPESYSVYIDHEEVRNGSSIIEQVLRRYSKEEIRRKREKVIETIPSIIYGIQNGGSSDFRDAFDIALDGVLERIKKKKRELSLVA